MATLTRGQTFGSTEQVTNTKLHALVDSATITGIVATELAANILNSFDSSYGTLGNVNLKTNFLTSMATLAGTISNNIFRNVMGSYATNASLINIMDMFSINVYYSTFGSIATFINPRIGLTFRVVSQQASFPVIVDTGAFKLAGNWIPAKQYDNISLMWDGSAFIEVARVTT